MIKTEESIKLSKGNARVRHIVKLGPDGSPEDECLCGYIWDQLHVPHNGEICQECVEIQKKL